MYCKKNNLSETAFALKTKDGYDLKWFTPKSELDKLLGLTEVDMKGLFIIGLLDLFQILFVIDGVVSAIKNIVWLIPLAISLIVFLIIMLIYLNDSASIYLIYYSVSYLLGFVPTKLILKFKNSKVK